MDQENCTYPFFSGKVATTLVIKAVVSIHLDS